MPLLYRASMMSQLMEYPMFVGGEVSPCSAVNIHSSVQEDWRWASESPPDTVYPVSCTRAMLHSPLTRPRVQMLDFIYAVLRYRDYSMTSACLFTWLLLRTVSTYPTNPSNKALEYMSMFVNYILKVHLCTFFTQKNICLTLLHMQLMICSKQQVRSLLL